MTMGRKMLLYAIVRWKICVARNRWPGYPAEVVAPQFPPWAESQWLEREIVEDEWRKSVRADADHIMAG